MTECVEFDGPRNHNGYGWKSGRLAHRVAWIESNGAIPEGLCVLHRCDNRACINTDHLWLGTKKDNAVDMARKGRQWQQKKEACQQGHPLDGRTLSGTRFCLECSRARKRRWNEKNREKKLDIQREYRKRKGAA